MGKVQVSKYNLTVVIAISVSTTVEADTLESAIEQAQAHPMQGLCHQCSSGHPNEEWVTGGELDGDPYSGKLVEVYSDNGALTRKDMRIAKRIWRGKA